MPVWSVMALHRPAAVETRVTCRRSWPGGARHDYVCVYPFVRSYDWYLLPDAERRAMLAEHGQMARGYADVRANTVSAFALGDYEWVLAFEADAQAAQRVRRPDAPPARLPGPHARPGGAAVLHRSAQAGEQLVAALP